MPVLYSSQFASGFNKIHRNTKTSNYKTSGFLHNVEHLSLEPLLSFLQKNSKALEDFK